MSKDRVQQDGAATRTAYPAWSRFTAAMMQRPAVAAALAAESIVLG